MGNFHRGGGSGGFVGRVANHFAREVARGLANPQPAPRFDDEGWTGYSAGEYLPAGEHRSTSYLQESDELDQLYELTPDDWTDTQVGFDPVSDMLLGDDEARYYGDLALSLLERGPIPEMTEDELRVARWLYERSRGEAGR